MKLTFTFTDSPDLKALSREDIFRSPFALPDTVLQLPDARDRILSVANLVSQLTDAVLHFTCREVGLKDLPFKLTRGDSPRTVGEPYVLLLRFSRHLRQSSRNEYRDLKVLLPVDSHMNLANRHRLVPPSYVGSIETEKAFVSRAQQLAQECLLLLNTEPPPAHYLAWEYLGFHPRIQDEPLRTRFNKRARKGASDQRKRLRLEEKQQEREGEGGQPHPISPSTGAGRRVGAVPGKFRGVQFRSQLEIRFVTKLEAEQIRWVYEGERLGEGNYLVDFYLPDLKTWVEVKGRLEPRDDYLLKEVAAYLEQERGERLFVYTQSKAFAINSQDFQPLSHDEFWSKLVP